MSSITTIIETATRALAGVTPGTLTSDQLNSSRQMLDAIEINEAIDIYWRELPGKPEKEDELPEWEALMREKGKEINRELHLLNEELSRIKSLHNTLNLDALEPLIKSAQEIIRPMYNFTAALNA